MSEYSATLEWKRSTESFDYDDYNRDYEIKFEGGQHLIGSAAFEYKGKANLANPEEMLAASLSSCHMLTFLAIASKKKIPIDSYKDHAVAKLAKNKNNKMAVVEAELHPKVEFSGVAPSEEEIRQMHQKAHENCFIANSVNFPVRVII